MIVEVPGVMPSIINHVFCNLKSSILKIVTG